jgi:hypothetical protein
MFWRRKKIYDQIDEYLEWKSERYGGWVEGEREYLTIFAKCTGIKEVNDIIPEDLVTFRKEMHRRSKYYLRSAYCSVRNLLRYYRARKMKCIKPEELMKCVDKVIL